MAMLAQKMERARLDNDSAELFQLDMPEDSDESTRAIVTPTASLEEPDGATVIQSPYCVRRVSRDSQDDDADDAWGQFLDSGCFRCDFWSTYHRLGRSQGCSWGFLEAVLASI